MEFNLRRKLWMSIGLGFVFSIVFAFYYMIRPQEGEILFRCLQPSDSIRVEFQKSGKVFFDFLAKPSAGDSSIRLQVSKTTAFDQLKVNCKVESAKFISKANTINLSISSLNEDSFIGSIPARYFTDRWFQWFSGFLISLLILTAFVFTFFGMIRKIDLGESVIELIGFLIFTILIFSYHWYYSPGVLNAYNPADILIGSLQNQVSNFEGALYVYFVNSFLEFAPTLQFISFLQAFVVILALTFLLKLFDGSKYMKLTFVGMVLLMFYLSPVLGAFSQHLERSVWCQWIFILFLALAAGLKLKKEEISIRSSTGKILFFLMILLSLLRNEYAIFSGLFILIFFDTSISKRLATAGIVLIVTVVFAEMTERIIPSDHKWRNRYYLISLSPYAQNLVSKSMVSDAELEEIEPFFDIKVIKNSFIHQDSIRPSAPLNLTPLLTLLFKKYILDPKMTFDFLSARLIRCFSSESWILTSPTVRMVDSSTSFLILKANHFLPFEFSVFDLKRVYEGILSDKLWLSYFASVLLILPFLFRMLLVPALISLVLLGKLVVNAILIPATHLAYVFDVYFLSLPLVIWSIFSLYFWFLKRFSNKNYFDG